MIRIATLGRFVVFRDGVEWPAIPAQPLRAALLLYLAIEREATRERALALLWPERSEARARHALSQSLSDLRRLLEGPGILAQGELLRATEELEVDALDFQRAVDGGEYARALELYAGVFLDGWHLVDSPEFETWLDRQRTRLAHAFRNTARTLARERVAAGDGEGGVAAARRWANLEPLEAEAQHLLAETLAECGRFREAVRVLEEYCQLLDREGDPPTGATLALMQGLRTRGERDRPLRVPGGRPRLLVLPFLNRGPPSQAYLVDGVTDDVMSRLARMPGLAMIARATATAVLRSEQDPAVLAERVNADFVLAGAVLFSSASAGGGAIRITAELLGATGSECVWTESFETAPGDVSWVPDGITEGVAHAMGLRLVQGLPARTRARQTTDPRAYDLYLRGRHAWNRRTADGLREAMGYLQRAIEIDSGYALAYAGLADAFAMLPAFTGGRPEDWHRKALATAARALALDETLAEAHAAAGLVASIYEWDWMKAERHLDRATQLAPSYAPAWVWKAYVLSCTGRPGISRAAMDQAYSLDPLSVATNFDAGFHGWQLRDRRRAVLLLSRALEFEPSLWGAAYLLGAIHFYGSDLAAAATAWRQISALGPGWTQVVANLERPAAGVEAVERFLEEGPRPVYWYLAATLFSLFGASERALSWMERHFDNVRQGTGEIATGGPNLAYAATEPLFDPLRGDPRFRALLGRMGLPD